MDYVKVWFFLACFASCYLVDRYRGKLVYWAFFATIVPVLFVYYLVVGTEPRSEPVPWFVITVIALAGLVLGVVTGEMVLGIVVGR